MSLLAAASHTLLVLTFSSSVSNAELKNIVDKIFQPETCFPMMVTKMRSDGEMVQERQPNCQPSKVLNNSYRWET